MSIEEDQSVTVASDLQDERLHRGFKGGVIRRSIDRVRAGDLGVLPVAAGLILIAVIFQSLNSAFLSSANLSNLLMESSAVGVIALGVVCVLLVGEIDLSVGSVSGDRKSTRLNSSHVAISYAVFCLKKKKMKYHGTR